MAVLMAAGPASGQTPGRPPHDAPPAAGGPPLLRAAETALVTVVGVVHEPKRLDRHAFTAEIAVERVIAGDLGPRARRRIAWEELAERRRLRFTEGERILVALDPLPGASLWRKRFPKGDALAVAAGGHAFIRKPDPASLTLLEAHLRIPEDGRRREPGVDSLAAIVAGASPVLAGAALGLLAEVPGLAGRVGEGSAAQASLGRALLDDGRPLPMRGALLEVAGRAKLRGLRPTIEKLAVEGSPLEAPALGALARLDGGLPPERVKGLLARSEPSLRAAAIRHGGDAISTESLPGLLVADPEPLVRSAAVETLLARRGEAGLDTALPALTDEDARVRMAASRSIAGLGDSVVPRLRTLVETGDSSQLHRLAGPAMTLALTGPKGRTALTEISHTHEDERIRKLARFALGQLGETH